MPVIFRNLPFVNEFTTVEVQGQAYRVFPLEIIVWVSLSPKGLRDLHPRTPRFPAVFDPAFTDTFLIHEQHLRRFAGLQLEHLRPRNIHLRTRDRIIPVHAGNVWLHRNESGQRDRLANAAPFLLELHRGIGITTSPDLYPRLPLLGARALHGARLQVFLDYHRCRMSARTPRKFWIFG